MLKSIEKLRGYKTLCKEHGVTTRYEPANRIADEIEEDIAEHYMPLPLDADGVPIHVGDELTYHNDSFIVRAIHSAGIFTWAPVKLGEEQTLRRYDPAECTHYKPYTVEDVLREFVKSGEPMSEGGVFYDNALIEKYADKLRDMFGGEE